MPRNFDFAARLRKLEPRLVARLVLGLLLAANLAAAWFVFNPPGGSIASLGNDSLAIQQEMGRKRQSVRALEALVARVDKTRAAVEQFEKSYFLSRSTAASTLVEDLGQAARSAGIVEREKGYVEEGIEGSEDLRIFTITANYEGSYADLVEFVNQIDRSRRLLIIEALQAQPQQAGQGLSIQVKLSSIVREGGVAPAAPASQAPSADSPAPTPPPVTAPATAAPAAEPAPPRLYRRARPSPSGEVR